MCSSVIGGSLFIPYIFSVEFDLLMIRVCTFFRKKKDKKEKEINKKNALICFVYDILLHQALMSSFEGCLLGICIIEGSCEKAKIKKEKKTHYYVCIWYLAPLGTYVIF